MANLVNQPTLNPSRKLSAAVVSVAVLEVLWVALNNLAPSWADPTLKAALTPVMVFIAGYLIRDEAQPVTASTIEYDDTEHA
jgi:hypothetical protein